MSYFAETAQIIKPSNVEHSQFDGFGEDFTKIGQHHQQERYADEGVDACGHLARCGDRRILSVAYKNKLANRFCNHKPNLPIVVKTVMEKKTEPMKLHLSVSWSRSMFTSSRLRH